MKATVVSISHTYTDDEIARETASGPFMILLHVGIRPADEREGADIFDVYVCNLKWVLASIASSGAFWEKDTIVVEDWNSDEIERIIRTFVGEVEEADWGSIATALRGRLRWEFEDYDESPV
jgi:hypothetical protein